MCTSWFYFFRPPCIRMYRTKNVAGVPFFQFLFSVVRLNFFRSRKHEYNLLRQYMWCNSIHFPVTVPFVCCITASWRETTFYFSSIPWGFVWTSSTYFSTFTSLSRRYLHVSHAACNKLVTVLKYFYLFLQNDVLLRCGVAVLFMSCLYGYCFRVLVHESLYAPLLAKTSSSVTTLLILLGSLEVVRFALWHLVLHDTIMY